MKIGGNHFEFRARTRLAGPRIVEKPNGASQLDEENLRDPAPPMVRVERRKAARASRYGTYYAGGADRRGMQARFVAQVLGQILDSTQNSTLLATRTYARSNRERKPASLMRVL
jgi:uncharacterized protein YceH (UPF0502 family)